MTSAPFDSHSSESHAYNKTHVLTLARMTTRAEHNISWSHTDKSTRAEHVLVAHRQKHEHMCTQGVPLVAGLRLFITYACR